ncbi:MAG: hypothetical protein AAFS01_15730 [Pseudomonadota bacterium]
MNRFLTAAVGAVALLAVDVGAADASHGRGGVIVPEIDANGMLTVTGQSFWDPTGIATDGITSVRIVGPGINTTVFDNAGQRTETLASAPGGDARRDQNGNVFTQQLSGAGTYTISWESCCMVGGIRNLQSSSSSSFGTTSTIVWDGVSAIKPILFDLTSIQQEVERGATYSDNLDALAGPGLTLSYTDPAPASPLNTTTPFGYSIDSTGTINISAADTAAMGDNTGRPTGGADYVFDGEISAQDSTGAEVASVEFYWVFDAVDSTGPGNRAPSVSDLVVNATVGDMIDETFTATDPDGDAVTLSFLQLVGSGGQIFTSMFDPVTGEFDWDTTGFAPGTYLATVQGSDPFGLTDVGTLTINLSSAPPSGVVPLPAPALLLLTGLLGAGGIMRARKRKQS